MDPKTSQSKIIRHVPDYLSLEIGEVEKVIQEFVRTCRPTEEIGLHVFADAKTKACYCECHLRADVLIKHSTIDVPLDPEEQAEYRANREVVEDHAAYERMQEDALSRRTFSNIVAEFTTTFSPETPLKIIGGQHRFNAIANALKKGINELHGLKIYFGLNSDQRLDVQLISNTNIAASSDLIDRMQETLLGPHLRDWCQSVGLLEKNTDFADRRQLGKAVTVRAARTFIVNYFRGKSIDAKAFDDVETQPIICRSGEIDSEWERIRATQPDLWDDPGLKAAGKAFAELVTAQRTTKAAKPRTTDAKEKALHFAVFPAWAFVAGILHNNLVRLKRHFALAETRGKDPLNADALARGRHKTDPDNYRGLGYRHEAKERGRFTELFYLQSEKGDGISPSLVDLAIKKFHAKQAVLDVRKAEGSGD